MIEQILTIQEVAKLYKTSEAAIRTAIWRKRHEGKDPGIPMPFLVRRRYRWLRAAVMRDLRRRGRKGR